MDERNKEFYKKKIFLKNYFIMQLLKLYIIYENLQVNFKKKIFEYRIYVTLKENARYVKNSF